MSPPPVVFKTMSFESAPAPAPTAPHLGGARLALRLAAAVIDFGILVGLFVFAVAMAGSIALGDGLRIEVDGGPKVVWLAVLLLHPFVMLVLTGRTPGRAALGLRTRP